MALVLIMLSPFVSPSATAERRKCSAPLTMLRHCFPPPPLLTCCGFSFKMEKSNSFGVIMVESTPCCSVAAFVPAVANLARLHDTLKKGLGDLVESGDNAALVDVFKEFFLACGKPYEDFVTNLAFFVKVPLLSSLRPPPHELLPHLPPNLASSANMPIRLL